MGARTYDPDLLMFLQPDWWEVTEPGVGTNRYAYAFGDPVNMSDANGHFVPVVIAIAVGVSYLIGAEAANAPGPDDATVPSDEGAKRMVGAAVSVGAAGPSAVRLGIACVTNPACASEAVSAIGAAEEGEAVAAGVDAAATEEQSIAATAQVEKTVLIEKTKVVLPAGRAAEIFGFGKGKAEVEAALATLNEAKVAEMKAQTTREAVELWRDVYAMAAATGKEGGAVAPLRLELLDRILSMWGN